ncbi:hypothetical protein [Vallitalea guaymasensis]|uniref:hypothetical protein n=1 Tax=Vallitalea guaymasensis TaxID=1185412 RepID=UPI00187D3A69|nr:hypothetical protein [Vallitalea guaymasensis]
MKKEQIDRMNKINELIEVIANTDRQFFYSDGKGTISKFVDGNKLFFVDKYTRQKIYPYPSSKKLGFSDGGTLWGLINDFREWIITGKRTNGNNGYGGLYCTHWGYTIEGMDKVISKAKEIGYLKQDAISFGDMCLKLKDDGNEWLLGVTVRSELNAS